MFTFALNVMLLVYTVQMHIFGLIKKKLLHFISVSECQTKKL